jgi:CHAD domain-containing protein
VAYRLKSGEPVSAGIKRVVREEIEAAARQLSGQGEADRDEAIHEARKSVKKIRGVLLLMRPELGEIFATENARFRDIGRQLSQFRDAGAIIETFDALRRKYRGEMDGRALARIRRRLMAHKKQAEEQGNIAEVLAGMAAELLRSAARVDAWPLFKDGFGAIAPGLEATFHRGQKALARTRKHARPENYHDWRKRVKAHWYHVRLLESLWTPGMQAYEKTLKELEACLGEDHNLVVLGERLQADPEIGMLPRLIRKYQKELRGQALELGERIYAEGSAHFTRRIERLWDRLPGLPEKKTAARRRPSLSRSALSGPPVTDGSGNRIAGPNGLQGLPMGVPQ